MRVEYIFYSEKKKKRQQQPRTRVFEELMMEYHVLAFYYSTYAVICIYYANGILNSYMGVNFDFAAANARRRC